MRVHLDTHAAIWLWQGRTADFGGAGRRALERGVLRVSPAVRLELQFLREIDRLVVSPDQILGGLEADCGVQTADAPFGRVVATAMGLGWTRDPFDRLIVAHAALDRARLLTYDARIRTQVAEAIW